MKSILVSFWTNPFSLSPLPQLRTAFMLAAGSAGSSTGDIFFPLLWECKLHWRYIRWLSFQLFYKAVFLINIQSFLGGGADDCEMRSWRCKMQRKTSLKELKEVDKVKWAKALFNWIIKAEIHSSPPQQRVVQNLIKRELRSSWTFQDTNCRLQAE